VDKTDIIDTHAHIFRRGAELAADRRYAPGYEALPEALLAAMAARGVRRAILVQPSFLGVDNSFLIEAMAAAPARFAGVAVVPPDIGRAGLAALKAAGVVGVRLNCIGRPAPDPGGGHRPLVEALASLGLVLQIQAEGAQWRSMEAALAAAPGPVVIDHFGRTPVGHESGGFESLLRAAARSPDIWFKFSAPYRLAENAAPECARRILDTVGGGRVIWGSDWPHTQHEGRFGYDDTLGWLEGWMPSAEDRRAALGPNAMRLFGM
jgi:predicted TIM-barrel fold metal-dependent hydrolase